MTKDARFRKTWDFFVNISNRTGLLAGVMTLVMMVAILREVIGRYFFRYPSDWSLELCGYLLVALAYLGAPYTELQEGNIRIDFFYSRLRGKTKKYVDFLIYLIGICWSAMVMVQGYELAIDSLKMGNCSSEAMGWPLFPSQVLIPIGSFLLCLVLLGKLISVFRVESQEEN